YLYSAVRTVIDPLSLHDALPISRGSCRFYCAGKENKPLGQIEWGIRGGIEVDGVLAALLWESTLWAGFARTNRAPWSNGRSGGRDRKSTRLNSSHVSISYAVFCL